MSNPVSETALINLNVLVALFQLCTTQRLYCLFTSFVYIMYFYIQGDGQSSNRGFEMFSMMDFPNKKLKKYAADPMQSLLYSEKDLGQTNGILTDKDVIDLQHILPSDKPTTKPRNEDVSNLVPDDSEPPNEEEEGKDPTPFKRLLYPPSNNVGFRPDSVSASDIDFFNKAVDMTKPTKKQSSVKTTKKQSIVRTTKKLKLPLTKKRLRELMIKISTMLDEDSMHQPTNGVGARCNKHGEDAGDKEVDSGNKNVDQEVDSGNKNVDQEVDTNGENVDQEVDAGDKNVDQEVDTNGENVDQEVDAGDKNVDQEVDSGNKNVDQEVDAGDKNVDQEVDSRNKNVDQEVDSGNKNVDQEVDAGDKNVNQEVDSGNKNVDQEVDSGNKNVDQKVDAGDKNVDRETDTSNKNVDQEVDTSNVNVDEEVDQSEKEEDKSERKKEQSKQGTGIIIGRKTDSKSNNNLLSTSKIGFQVPPQRERSFSGSDAGPDHPTKRPRFTQSTTEENRPTSAMGTSADKLQSVGRNLQATTVEITAKKEARTTQIPRVTTEQKAKTTATQSKSVARVTLPMTTRHTSKPSTEVSTGSILASTTQTTTSTNTAREVKPTKKATISMPPSTAVVQGLTKRTPMNVTKMVSRIIRRYKEHVKKQRIFKIREWRLPVFTVRKPCPVRADAIFTSTRNKVYVIDGDLVYVIGRTGVEAGPTPIREYWPQVSAPIDDVYVRSQDRQAVFFSKGR